MSKDPIKIKTKKPPGSASLLKKDRGDQEFEAIPKQSFGGSLEILEILEISPDGVTFDELIETITSIKIHTCKLAVAYFFVCYPAIPLSGSRLADSLLNLFLHSADNIPKRSRILSCFNLWVDKWDAFSMEIGPILTKIKSFCHVLHKSNDLKFLSYFEVVITKVLSKQTSTEQQLQTFQLLQVPGIKALTWPEAKARHFAEQLTLFHYNIFQRISSAELLKPKSGKMMNNTSLGFFIQQFNVLSLWVKSTILTEGDLKKRRTTCKRLIDVCETLKEVRNFTGLFAIMAGLSSVSVQKLKDTWDGLDLTVFNKLKETVSISSNYSLYRAELKQLDLPTIPFLGKHMTDLLHFQEAMEDTVDGKINFFKHISIGKLINDVMQFKAIPYSFPPKTEYLAFFSSIAAESHLIDEDELWKLSGDVEEGKKKSHNRSGEKNRRSKKPEKNIKSDGDSGSNHSRTDAQTTIETVTSEDTGIDFQAKIVHVFSEQEKLSHQFDDLSKQFKKMEDQYQTQLQEMKTLMLIMSKQIEKDKNEIAALQKELRDEKSRSVMRSTIQEESEGQVKPQSPRDRDLKTAKGPPHRTSTVDAKSFDFALMSYTTLLSQFFDSIADSRPDLGQLVYKAKVNAQILNITTVQQLAAQVKTKELATLGFPFLLEPLIQELLKVLETRAEKEREAELNEKQNEEVRAVLHKLKDVSSSSQSSPPTAEEIYQEGEGLQSFLSKVLRKSRHNESNMLRASDEFDALVQQDLDNSFLHISQNGVVKQRRAKHTASLHFVSGVPGLNEGTTAPDSSPKDSKDAKDSKDSKDKDKK